MTLDRRRRRLVSRVFLVGPVLGVIGAAVLGLSGFPGRVGFLSVVVFTAFGAALGAIVAAVLAIVDEARREAVSPRRLAQIGVLFATAALCLLMLGALSSA